MKPEDRLRSELRRVVEGADLGHAPPASAVQVRGQADRRHRRRQGIAVGATVVVVYALLLSLIVGGSRSPGGKHVRVGQRPGGTYVLSNISIEYPFHPIGPWPRPDDPDKANVTFRIQWTGGENAGFAMCYISVLDEHGNIVGSSDGGLFEMDADAIEDGGGRTVDVEMGVSAPPVSAEGYCDRGIYGDGPGYEFEVTSIDEAEDGQGSVIRTNVHWTQSGFPGMRQCDHVVRMRDGSEHHEVHWMFVRLPNRDVSNHFFTYGKAQPEDIKSASITCREPNISS